MKTSIILLSLVLCSFNFSDAETVITIPKKNMSITWECNNKEVKDKDECLKNGKKILDQIGCSIADPKMYYECVLNKKTFRHPDYLQQPITSWTCSSSINNTGCLHVLENGKCPDYISRYFHYEKVIPSGYTINPFTDGVCIKTANTKEYDNAEKQRQAAHPRVVRQRKRQRLQKPRPPARPRQWAQVLALSQMQALLRVARRLQMRQAATRQAIHHLKPTCQHGRPAILR